MTKGIALQDSDADVKEQLRLLSEQNIQLKNSNRMLGHELQNGITGIIAAAQNQFNITSFNPLFQANIAAPITINYSFLNYFYKTHGIIQTAVDQPVLDALSSGDQTGVGVTLNSKLMDEEDMSDLMVFMEDEDIWGCISQAMIWARLFGGGAIIIDDGGKYDQPLTPEMPIRVLKLYAASRWELGAPQKLAIEEDVVTNSTPWQTYASMQSEFYSYYGQQLHKSRVIAISGKEAPWMVRWQLQGWGMSEIERMVEDFNLYLRERNVLYELMNEAKVDVFRIEGMRELLMTPGGDQKMLNRITTVQQAKNMNNALLLDKMDEYEQKQLSFTGIAETMKEVRMAIASACKMPISKIFGVGATGFSSGEDDLENYNSMVQSTVRSKLRKPIRQVIDLVMRYKWGAIAEDYKISFKPLRVMSAKDEEEMKDRKFNRAIVMYDHGLMDSEEVGDECAKERLISIDTKAAAGELDEFPEGPMGTQASLEQETMKSKESKKGENKNGK